MKGFNSQMFILTLLNIPRVGRKAVNYIVKNSSKYSLDENDILDIFKEINIKNKKIRVPKLNDIILAKEKAKSVLDKTYELNIGVLTVLDLDFPNNLSIISDPPVIIFYKGNKECLYEDKSVAIIGSRKPTQNGIKAAQRLGYLFGESNFTVVSGLAIGCDENAHKGCLDANGRTIAVLPCGLDYIYPASNKKLVQEIIDKDGCIVSEYQVGVKAFKNYFVERDRLESAFSKAVIVVETSVKSGTMHTVEFCKEQGKILAVYKPNDKFKDCDEVQGNRLLMKEKKTLILDSSESVGKLKKLILDISNNSITNINNNCNEQLKFL